MRRLPLALLGLLLIGRPGAHTTPPQGLIDKTPQLKAYINARIHTTPDRVLEHGVLVIDSGRVIAVGADVDIPPGAVEVDLEGKAIYPGFIDPYTDYGLKEIEASPPKRGSRPVYEAERVGCNAWNEAIHAEKNWVESFKPDSKAAEEWLQLGFTSVQSARLDGVFRGRGFMTSLGDGLPNDLVVRPYTWQFLGLDKGSSKQEYPGSLMGCIALIRQTFLDADWYGRAQAAYALDRSQPKPEINTALAALQTTGDEKLLAAAGDAFNLFRVDNIGKEFDLDIVPVCDNSLFEWLDDVKATGRTVILDLDFPKTPAVDTYDGELDVTLQELRRWDWAPSNPARLAEAGIRFALTTHGLKKKEKFLDNLRQAVKRGLNPSTALAALTTVPAELCGVSDRLGSLESGKLADFVVTDGDLFEDDTKILAAYTRGQVHEFVDLDRADYAGYYEGSLGEKELSLKLSDRGYGAKRKIRGTLIAGDKRVKVGQAEVTRDVLNFTAPLDSLGWDGVARFSLRRDDEDLVGTIWLADGDIVTFVAERAEPPRDDDSTDTPPEKPDSADQPEAPEDTIESTEEVIDESSPPSSRVTFPNMAYGFEELPQAEKVLIRGGTIWTSEAEGILEDADLLVSDGVIEAVGQGLEAPVGYRVIDATGKHVTAGIIDEHSHICVSGDVNEGTDAITSETRLGDVIDAGDISVYRSLAGGVTCTRTSHGSANPIGGQSQVIKLRWGETPERMKSDEAPPSIKFALGENVKQSNWGDRMTVRYPQSRMGVERIIRDVFQAAREYEAEWAAYNQLRAREKQRTIPPTRNLRLEAILEILKKERFIACHAYVQSEILMLMRLCEDFGISVTNFVHILEGYKVAEEMAAHGAMGGSIPDWWAYKFEVYDAIPHGPAIMTEQGVVVSITSDSQHLQRLLNQAAAKSVQYADMSQEEAWKMVTINPAKQIKAEDHLGSLKSGKDADFVIWDGNPLSVYSRVEQTWIDGKKYFDREVDRRLRVEVDEERNRLIQKVLQKPEKHKWDRDYDDSRYYQYPPDSDREGDRR